MTTDALPIERSLRAFNPDDPIDEPEFDLSITITSPAAGANASGQTTMTVTGEADVVGAAIDRVEVTVGTGAAARVATLTGPKTSHVTWSAPNVAVGAAQGDTLVVTATVFIDGNFGDSVTRNLVADHSPPILTITTPATMVSTLTNGQAVFTIQGNVVDAISAIDKVEFRLAGGAFQPATRTGGSWTTGNAIVLTTESTQDVQIRARDVHGNTSVPATVTLRAIKSFVPHDSDDVFGPADYLDDLITFAAARIKVNNTTQTAPAFAATLEGLFRQRFGALVSLSNQDVASETVRQVRVCVEVLRRYLPAGQGLAPAAEATYLAAAYDAVLGALGTSVSELVRSRADGAARASLAARLAIEPARLDAFPVASADVTEAKLEALFGLVSTSRDVMAVRPPTTPDLARFRLESLAVRWSAEDDAQRMFGTVAVPVVDPDLLTAADLVPATAAQTLFTQRAQALAALAANVRKRIADDGLDPAIGAFVGSAELLAKLRQAQQAGVDVRADLDALRIAPAGFRRLMQIRDLAQAGTAIELDLAEAEAILVAVQKVRLSESQNWRAQERAAGLTHLDPGQFHVQPSAAPAVDPLRAPSAARRRWRHTLEARAAEAAAAASAVASAADAAEGAALPGLRDALVAKARTLAPSAGRPSVDGLLIDTAASSEIRTTRVTEALATLQAVILAVRNDGFSRFAQAAGGTTIVHPADAWDVGPGTKDALDADLEWWGGQSTWKAAAQALAFPDTRLLPSMRAGAATPTQAFRDLAATLRDAPALTPDQARTAVKAYVAALKVAVVSPNLPVGYQPTERLTDTDLAARRQQCAGVFASSSAVGAAVHVQEAFFFVPILCAQHLARAGEFLAAIDWLKTVYAYHLPPGDQRNIYHGLTLEQTTTSQFPRPADSVVALANLNPLDVAASRNRALKRFVVFNLVRCFVGFADAEFARDTGESLARARLSYETALSSLPELTPSGTAPDVANPYLVDPVVQALRDHVGAQLGKLHAGRNIAGLPRAYDPPAASRSIAPRQPTPFRFSALILRAKELVQLAAQIEAALLAALEKRDNEEYTLLRARQDVALALETVTLQNLRVTEARHGVTLAQLQQDRAELQVDHLEEELEFDEADVLEIAGFLATAAGQVLGGFIPGSGGEIPVVGAIAGIVGGVGTIANGFSAREQRRRDLEFQLALAEQDVLIGAQQVTMALDAVAVTNQERRIAQLQAVHAAATVEFLARKLTNVELYEFMSEVLVEVYRGLLQHATATVRLAEAQLAFERQAPLLGVVRGDYWAVSADGRGLGSSQDRQGLTGSARLLGDTIELEQRAFLTDRRRLQLTKTISLARLAPAAFQRFRATGVLAFATSEAMFDEDFPGHYLRLIKRVRMSTLALVSPHEGIRAELSCSGVSRTVAADGDAFRSVTVRRDPETVALSATRDATGLFELVPDARPDLLLPFEGNGVEALWRLEMPKAANRLDFGSISDVLVTIEYEALSSAAYRGQVVARLDRQRIADRPFSLRSDYPDQWFDLHNPDQSPQPLAVTIPVTRADFPPNLDEFRTEHLVVCAAPTDGNRVELADVTLSFNPDGAAAPLSATTSTQDGIITTRRTSNAAWLPLTGRAPFGTWTLTLPDTPALRTVLADEGLDDILFVITHSARTPEWPS